MDSRAIVLISGGLDSPTVLAYAMKHGYKVFPLSFDYGQRHRKELISSKNICDYYKLKLKVINFNMQQIGGSALTDNIDVPDRGLAGINGEIPLTYVPARNTIFLAIAAGYAETVGAETIFIGANAIDYSGYPDCRPDFFNSMENSLNLGTELGIKNGFKINVPLQYLGKSDIIKLGRKLGVPYKMTWSCYKGEEKACGKCDSCILRLKGFMEAGDTDDIEYSYYPDFYREYLKTIKGGNI
ncbi:MAG: 7-cyano-7-deazaguanine synthase QueC [Ferroplasma sp.]